MEPAANEDNAAASKGGFLIRKSTMIRKNENAIEDVYKVSKKALGTGAYGVVSSCVHRETK